MFMSQSTIIRAVTGSQSVGFHRNVRDDVKALGFEAVSLSSPGPEADALKASGWVVETVDMERHISPVKDIKALLKLIGIFKRLRPMMVHSMTPKAGLLCMLAAWLTRVPLRVHTFTGLVFPTSTGLKRRILMATDSLTCACATHVIPEGEGVKNDLLNHHITHKPIRVLGYGNVRGIDLDRFNPQNPAVRHDADKLRRPDLFTFIFVGRLVGDKGINELVEAFVRLHTIRPLTRLILVGRRESELDPLKPETEAEIENNPAIEAVGQQSDVRPWLAASDAFVFPSYREGFPNVVIEAGAMNLPSIVTDINGSREIIHEGENGTIIPSKNIDALYAAMLRFATDSPMLEAMASRARPLIVSRYEQNYVRQCLLNFYKDILPQ